MTKSKKKSKSSSKKGKKSEPATLKLKTEHDIAIDLAIKVYKKYDKMVKSVILFGSTVKKDAVVGSDIDIVILIDDVAVRWDQELIAWYRTELEKIVKSNPYSKELHINTIKLSTWWNDLMIGDPTVLNIIRYGEALLDFAGFFDPLKYLLVEGKIKSTPEAIYNLLQRAPQHLMRSKISELSAIEGLYWCMVDSAHAALIAAKIIPPSPEHIPAELREAFVNQKMLDMKYVLWYRDLHVLHKQIAHNEIRELKGVEIDEWQEKTEEFLKVMAKLVDTIISQK